MVEKELPVTEDVYAAVLDLQERLQEAYGMDVTVSDTIDFLGHQFFVHQRLLDIARIQLQRMAEQKTEPNLLDKMLELVGLNMPEDATCFIKTDARVPLHWMSTRWLIDIEGRNIFKCLSEPESPEKAKEYKIDIK